MVNDTEIWGNCSICRHPRRSEIESVWLCKDPTRSNWSIRQMARCFGVSPSALERHCMRHVWVTLDEYREQITAEEYFEQVYSGASYIEPERNDVKQHYKAWLERAGRTEDFPELDRVPKKE